MTDDSNRVLLPIIPLARDAVLLPGITLRIPVQNRPDIPALLSAIYSQAAATKTDPSTISIGCVPLCSPFLSSEGQNLIEDSEARGRRTAEHLASKPGDVKEKDLYLYGTSARVSGVYGRRPGELSLVVEGQRRFRIQRFTKLKPHVECEAVLLGEESRLRQSKTI